jgi:hypothetical protein
VSQRIDKLKEAVETMHHFKARRFGSEPVIELFRGEMAWDGVVETFDFEGQTKAQHYYAWSYLEKDDPQYVTVLEVPPVDPAETAVKVAITAEAKK